MMSTVPTPAALWVAAAAVTAFGVASIAVHQPNGVSERSLAMDSLKRTLRALDDETRDTNARLAAYRDGLEESGARLRHVLRTAPVDTDSIARMAAVRWESDLLLGGPDVKAVTALIDLAAARAPRVAEIQVDLGELFYKMGRPDEAQPFMKRAVELSPSTTNRAVSVMAAAGVPPVDIVSALPALPTVLIATKDLFLSAGHGFDYLDIVERQLVNATSDLLSTYGEACLQLQVPKRLYERISTLPFTGDPGVHAERSRQLAHSLLSTGAPDRALEWADDARKASPGNSSLEEFYGEVALVAGRGSEAELSFRRALQQALAEDVGPARRAGLYDALGRSFEAQGRPDVAYDAFRQAVAIDPAAVHAQAKLKSYEHRGNDVPR